MLPRLLILAGFALLSASGLSAQDAEAYAVLPGDRITLQLFTAAGQKVDVVEGERIVDRGGEVFLPFVGTIQVAGLDQTEIRQRLLDAYGAYYSEPVLDLKVELKVSITGAVRSPGRYYLDPTATLAEALAVAGGATPEFAVTAVYLPSDPTRVRLVRDGVATVLNFRAQEVEQSTLDMRIKSGDWLHVPFQRRSRIRDEVQFWGSVVSLAASSVGLIFLITR
jgi:polysaccharide export outer membrane protein